MSSRRFTRLRRALLLLGVVLAASFLLWISRSTVVQTSGGVYDSILIPVGRGAVRWRADLARVADAPHLLQLHGPVITTTSTGATAQWFCRDSVARAPLQQNQVDIECLGRRSQVALRTGAETVVPNVLPATERIAVVSDLEGDVEYLRGWLRAVGVTDSTAAWTYGNGRLVVLGDFIDRGRSVYDLLWFLYALEGKARAAGGDVHLVLGNHEQYGFAGNIKGVEAEHLFAIEQMLPYGSALSDTTVLGRWLRSKPIVLRIGDVLFAHGGISSATLDAGQDLDAINQEHRELLAGRISEDSVRSRLTGKMAPTQYRGYRMATDAYPLAPQALIDRVRAQYGVRYIVVGHTEQDSLFASHGGAVFDVNTTLASRQALTFVGQRPVIVDAVPARVAFADAAPLTRPFSVFRASDWAAFFRVFAVAF